MLLQFLFSYFVIYNNGYSLKYTPYNSTTGNSIQKVEPWLGPAESDQTRPLCASTTPLTNERPKPVEFTLTLSESLSLPPLVKSLGLSSSDIPTPVSFTTSRIFLLSVACPSLFGRRVSCRLMVPLGV